MAKKNPGNRGNRDRYDVTGNVEAEYVDPEAQVLVNKLGITSSQTLQLTEKRLLGRAYENLFFEIENDTPITCSLIQRVHRQIFGELYTWAGQWRTVTISKPGVTWPPPAYLQQGMDEFERNVLTKLSSVQLTDDDDFCLAMARVQGEFLVVHPFREGNARTIKLVCDLIAAQTKRPILWYDRSEAGAEQYILPAGQAFRKNYHPMAEVIRTALANARQQS